MLVVCWQVVEAVVGREVGTFVVTLLVVDGALVVVATFTDEVNCGFDVVETSKLNILMYIYVMK